MINKVYIDDMNTNNKFKKFVEVGKKAELAAAGAFFGAIVSASFIDAPVWPAAIICAVLALAILGRK